MYDIIYIAFSFGLRVSELLQLKVSDIDFTFKRIYIRRLKGSNATSHLLSCEQLRVLRDREKKAVRGRLFHMHRSTVDRKMKEVCNKAKIPVSKAHMHTLKHTAAIMLLQSQVDIRTIQLFLGHKSIESTMQYLRITGKSIDEAGMTLDELVY